MRSKFVLITGCIVIALWAIGRIAFRMTEAADDPFHLVIFQPIISRLQFGRVGTTTAAIVIAVVTFAVLIMLVAFAIKRARARLKKDAEQPHSMLSDIRERLRTEYPKYSDRKSRNE